MTKLSNKQEEKLSVLQGLKIADAPALDVLRCCNLESYADTWARSRDFLNFALWIDSEGESVEKGTLARYAEHLQSIGNAKSTIAVKISHIRVILKAAIESGIIPEVVEKRGRKKAVEKKECAFKKTFINDLFAMDTLFAKPEEIKKQYHKLALRYHPDHGGNAETFMGLRHAFEFISNDRNCKIYNLFYVKDKPFDRIDVEVHEIYNQFGGYEAMV